MWFAFEINLSIHYHVRRRVFEWVSTVWSYGAMANRCLPSKTNRARNRGSLSNRTVLLTRLIYVGVKLCNMFRLLIFIQISLISSYISINGSIFSNLFTYFAGRELWFCIHTSVADYYYYYYTSKFSHYKYAKITVFTVNTFIT